MRRTTLMLCGLMTFGVGYMAGTSHLSLSRTVAAFDDAPKGGDEPEISLAKETQTKIHDAKLTLQDAMDALESEGRYKSITDGVNGFLILSGGGDAMNDIESGQGVDPETFAALYAGQAIPEVADHLAKDDQGRLTYKGKTIRMYSQSRLERAYALRTRLGNPTLQ